MYILIAIY